MKEISSVWPHAEQDLLKLSKGEGVIIYLFSTGKGIDSIYPKVMHAHQY